MRKIRKDQLPRFIVNNKIEPKFPLIAVQESKDKEGRVWVDTLVNGSLLCRISDDGFLHVCHLDDNLRVLGFKVDENGYVKIKRDKP